MKRWVSSVLAGFALAGVILCAPPALLVWGRLPRVDHGLAGPAMDGSLLLGVLTVLGWLAWAAFTVATVVEALSLRSGRPRALPGLGGFQRLTGSLLLLALAVLPVAGATSQAPRTVLHASAEPTGAEPTGAERDADEPASTPARHGAPAQSQGASDEETELHRYTVQPGDDLWTVAERLLGDGRQWRRIADLNPSLQDPTRDLVPGAALLLPERPRTLSLPSHPTASDDLVVRVRRGDTLSALAETHLGKAGRWPRIAAANPVITDPDHIEIGWRLTIPGAKHSAAPPGSPSDADGTTPAGRGETASEQTPHEHGDAAPPGNAQPQPSGPTVGATPTGTSTEQPPGTTDPPSPEGELPISTPLTVGTLAAAALVGALEARRALRERARPLGRRYAPASPEADRLRTVLRAAQRPAALDGLTAALHRVGSHCHAAGLDLPVPATVRVGADSVEFEWAEPCFTPPPGFSGDERRWVAALPMEDAPDQPCPYPALVSLGTAPDGEVLLVDAERSRVLGVAGTGELQADALAAMGVELACAPWSRETRLVVAGSGAELVRRAGEDRVQVVQADEALERLVKLVMTRRAALASEPLGRLRTDPDRAEAVAPYVFLFLDDVADATLAEIEEQLAGDPVGVAAILPTRSTAPALWQVSGDPARPDGVLSGLPGRYAAHAISAPARRGLGELLTDADPVAAPWWAEDNVYPLPRRAEEEVDIVRIAGSSRHPRLLLIGPADIVDAAGAEPSRARQQLVEMCAWLLEHPASTATRMAAGMALAEGTRRSNLSRLRAWLGEDPDGNAYLPEAYSGRISLHPGVTSDWQQLQLMLRPGVERVPDATLIAALELVRGAPLADAAPGQWYWAEELRTDISGALRDVGVVLTERALRARDLDLARWAASRALTVAPEDELLLCARLSTEHQAGNLAECERLANQLARQARILGVDLMPETVELCQRVIEGQLRARA